jgi:FAD-dependent oxidoreductase domain-containing protein 1
VDDIELGCCGGENEGWFDPWGLLSLLRSGASNKGAEFIQGEAVDFVFGANGELRGVVVD